MKPFITIIKRRCPLLTQDEHRRHHDALQHHARIAEDHFDGRLAAASVCVSGTHTASPPAASPDSDPDSDSDTDAEAFMKASAPSAICSHKPRRAAGREREILFY